MDSMSNTTNFYHSTRIFLRGGFLPDRLNLITDFLFLLERTRIKSSSADDSLSSTSCRLDQAQIGLGQFHR